LNCSSVHPILASIDSTSDQALSNNGRRFILAMCEHGLKGMLYHKVEAGGIMSEG
jgi:alanine dehydrogenase